MNLCEPLRVEDLKSSAFDLTWLSPHKDVQGAGFEPAKPLRAHRPKRCSFDLTWKISLHIIGGDRIRTDVAVLTTGPPVFKTGVLTELNYSTNTPEAGFEPASPTKEA